MRVLLLFLALVLAGCTTANMRRDLDVSGSLPRAIGLGAFAPTCFFLCFVETRTQQGNSVAETVEAGDPFIVRGSTSQQFKGGGATVKAKPKPKGKP